ncbi:TRAP transporter small permease subunit [Paeniroseomonas aquatica]|uniref:TRAP transporter small permease protein n=1 Tax=Paeniroseomonas aquatica TaxID=373043 RepID=A0ABT8A9G2_9PROT|nr:TRAP transporter small permease subunit [Paeniroseomonas aquatica]MDN3566340.1 TRAP transporter small permease subunit [Paeniroseomonas aquatica]
MADQPLPPRGAIAAAATALAYAGGAVLLATALLTTVSVVLRWLTRQPVPGDFELVSLGSGLAVVGFLAYGTLLRTNILVDTFTTWVPRRLARGVDAFWTLIWAGAAAVLAERLLVGATETLRTGTTTMVLGLPTWWAVGLAALGFGATALAALHWVVRLLRGHG